VRCFPCTELSLCWSSSRDVSPCRRFFFIREISMVRPGSDSWACSLPSTIIGQRSFDRNTAMTTQLIKNLFANDIHRRIEEVIKVDQTTDDILRDEINEYVVT